MFFDHVTKQDEAASEGGPASDDHDTASSRSPPISRAEAVELAATENQRVLELLRSARRRRLDQADRLPGWDVRAMAGHMRRDDGDVRVVPELRPRDAGGNEGGRRRPDGRRHDRRAGAPTAPTSRTAELIAQAAEIGPALGPVARRPCPALLRKTPMKEEVGGETGDVAARATCSTSSSPATRGCTGSTSPGRPAARWCSPPSTTAGIIADVVAEWARRHGQPFTLHLTGPAGGDVHATATAARRSPSTPSSSAAPFRAAPPGPACSPRRFRSDGDTSHRGRRRHPPAHDLRRRRRLQLQPVPRHRRRAAAVPHRWAPAVPARVARPSSKVVPVESLRWISFGHVESDESGSMNDFLAVAPQATVAQSVIGCMVSINDLADRPPRPLADGEVLDIGGHRMRWIDTPHVPHGWEAGVLYDETTKTLFCGDLFTRQGAYDGHQRRRHRRSRRSPPRTSTAPLSLSPKTGGIHPRARRARHRHARPHARPGLQRRLPRRRCSSWPTTSTAGSPPRPDGSGQVGDDDLLDRPAVAVGVAEVEEATPRLVVDLADRRAPALRARPGPPRCRRRPSGGPGPSRARTR